ncbi:alpha-ketoacid dehydrogenase subunit beta [Novosphingobium sp. PC22D]|uniref:alpha-ketoacid dehydrogenase subunit beta n=1 Tax=Novosphingobium sp. PC22D TaxID=1962403 RepID=UPI000BEFD357|nr:pyruvate dehydrogenase complex E1 component subunit beta [Novosphingobium sp. PC22D]PEQ13634.1 alpha-ketoacid dehydrogenase subunit beta [Novosphingobium sp. PC22D]
MSQVTFVQSINQALHDAMEDDARVLVLGEDVGDAEGGGVVGITKGLSQAFGCERVKSTPISEQAIMGAAIGAALKGFRPVAEIMLMNFTTVASDMIVNHAAKLRFMSGGQTSVPLVVRTMTGAGVSNGGQHSDYLEAWYAHTAGLKVVLPSTPADAYGLMRACIDDPDPCIFVETLPALFNKGEAPVRGSRVPLGKAAVLREGRDVSVIGYGRIIQSVAQLADRLAGEGVSMEVIDLRTVSPFDKEAVLASVRKTGAAVVVHEAVREFGVGSEISSLIHEEAFAALRAPVRRIGAKFAPVPFSKPLETASLPSLDEVEAAVRELAAVTA